MFFSKVTYTLTAEGMMCQKCAARAAAAVEQFPGARAEVNLEAKTITVVCKKTVDIEKIAEAVTAAGYPAKVAK